MVYQELLVVIFILLIIVLFIFFLCFFISNIQDITRLSPYECGFEAFSSSSVPFEVRYYRTAILFIIFDIEIVFLFPFVANGLNLDSSSVFMFLVFVLVLLFGFVYEWLMGGLDWD